MTVSVSRRLRSYIARLLKRFRTYPVKDLTHVNWEPLAMLDFAKRMPILVTAPLEQCRWTGPTGFPYGPGSPHPYVRTLLEYREHGSATSEHSYLAKYYAAFRPFSLAEFQGLEFDGHPSLLSLPPLNIYPWTPVSSEKLKQLLDGVADEVMLPNSFRVVRSCFNRAAKLGTSAPQYVTLGRTAVVRATDYNTNCVPHRAGNGSAATIAQSESAPSPRSPCHGR